MLAEGGMDDAHVKQNLGGVCNDLKLLQCIIELVVVVPRQGGDPSLYFLVKGSAQETHHSHSAQTRNIPVLTTWLFSCSLTSRCEAALTICVQQNLYYVVMWSSSVATPRGSRGYVGG